MTHPEVGHHAVHGLLAAGGGMGGMVAAGLIGAAAVVSAGVVGYGTFAPRSTLFGPVVSRARGEGGGAVALTFDDGPWPGATDAILDLLGRNGICATFFVIGRYAAEHPSLVRRMHDEGHLIGNHTFDHARWGMFRGEGYWIDQIRRTSDVIAGVTGCVPTMFRPPMGFKSPLVMRAAEACGTRVVTWTRRGFDGVSSTPHAIAGRLGGSMPGEILLLHDGRDPASRREMGATVNALSAVIEGLALRSIRMVRVDELLREDQPMLGA